MSENQVDVAIVGAGMTGVIAAGKLKDAGFNVLLFEEQSHVGGRMTTLEHDGGIFDIGAQFFTVKHPDFIRIIKQLVDQNLVSDWFHSQLIQGGASRPDGFPRYYGIGGMQRLIEHLSEDIPVLANTKISKLECKKDNWVLFSNKGEKWNARSVILTPPIPLALTLLESCNLELAEEDKASLEKVTYSRCLTVTAVLDGPSGLTEWGGLRIRGEYIDWIADNKRKGISPDNWAITIQAMPEFSQLYWESEDKEIVRLLTENASRLLVANVQEARVYRWKYSKPVTPHPDPYFICQETPPCILAGDGFRGHRVEGAVLSGTLTAEKLGKWFKGE